jgi:hypothetical protein
MCIFLQALHGTRPVIFIGVRKKKVQLACQFYWIIERLMSCVI